MDVRDLLLAGRGREASCPARSSPIIQFKYEILFRFFAGEHVKFIVHPGEPDLHSFQTYFQFCDAPKHKHSCPPDQRVSSIELK
jgi:hypothetical protein